MTKTLISVVILVVLATSALAYFYIARGSLVQTKVTTQIASSSPIGSPILKVTVSPTIIEPTLVPADSGDTELDQLVNDIPTDDLSDSLNDLNTN